MRFIGNKLNLLPFIWEVANKGNIHSGTLCDIFTGTTNVARFFKRKGFKIISNDLLHFSYAFQQAYIKNNQYPSFSLLIRTLKIPEYRESLFGSEKENLIRVINYLNKLKGKKSFIYQNYSYEGTKGKKHARCYFSAKNAMKIDLIRDTIQKWYNSGLINEQEFYVLVTSLIEAVPFVSNISGTYGAFLKKWDKRAFKPLTLTAPDLIMSNVEHEVHREDANKLIREISCDVLYIDPPYNTRQYVTNYHILETIEAWDNPKIYGKTGLRPYEDQKSAYCSRDKCKEAFADLIENAKCKHILFSYNTEGLIPRDFIVRTLSKKGILKVYERPYRRFKSDSNNEKRQYKEHALKEIIYYVKI